MVNKVKIKVINLDNKEVEDIVLSDSVFNVKDVMKKVNG